MNKTFIFAIISCLLTQNVIGILFGTGDTGSCPCNTTAFEADYYKATAVDFDALAGVAAQLVIAAVVAQILLILPSCPNFCLTKFAVKALPRINAGIKDAANKAARLNAKLVADKVEISSCKYNYVGLLVGSIDGVSVHMTECANNARVNATRCAIKALKDECPKLNTADVIETALTAILTVSFTPLVTVAIIETAKNLLLALPCGSWKILPGIDLSSLPGLGGFGFSIPNVLGGILG